MGICRAALLAISRTREDGRYRSTTTSTWPQPVTGLARPQRAILGCPEAGLVMYRAATTGGLMIAVTNGRRPLMPKLSAH